MAEALSILQVNDVFGATLWEQPVDQDELGARAFFATMVHVWIV